MAVISAFVVDGLIQRKDRPEVHRKVRAIQNLNWCLWTVGFMIVAVVHGRLGLAVGILIVSVVVYLRNRGQDRDWYELKFNERY
ncbi:hypothetical protein [Rhodococcus sp. ACT016]|uniref:hypothetical protein n=1 Tax=Rhodococcus sp. ACT016 TaxID=3134808 RepID=UPI003D2AFEF2